MWKILCVFIFGILKCKIETFCGFCVVYFISTLYSVSIGYVVATKTSSYLRIKAKYLPY